MSMSLTAREEWMKIRRQAVTGRWGRPFAVLGAAAALVLSAQAIAQTKFDRSRTVIFANGGVVATLDPMRTDYAQTSFIASTLYDTLVTYDSSGKLVGQLAETFELAKDAKSIDVRLRPGAVFHDGTPVTVNDVAYTLDRLKRLGLGIASQIDGYDKTTVADARTLTIHLSRPDSLFPGALSKVYILEAKLAAANAGTDDAQGWLQSHDAGSGPYVFSGRRNADIVVSQFPGYWNKVAGRPEQIVFRRIDEGGTQRDELLAGNIDLAVLGMGYRDAALLDKGGRVKDAHLKPELQTNIIFNTRTGPTADARVRRAIRLAYDYQGGLDAIRQGAGVIANGPLPSTMICRPDLPAAHRDVAEAKRLLAEAGVKNLQLTMRFQPTVEVQRLEATLLQSNLAEIGVQLKLEPISFAAYLASVARFDTIPQMMLLDDFAQFPDPGAILLRGYRSDAVGTNRGGYSNPKVDALLDAAKASSDAAKRCDLYKQVQVILDRDSVIMPLYTVGRPAMYRPQQIQTPQVNKVVFPLAPADLRLATKP
ncbi:ABC transporter substrate-binding protein [Paraburkholderia susongensis]|uniref:Peptide/nickel transport system substrate-binding protein n=1 Tax=Paraburkholderia susongensis TaxID=1515439 RepID=A0A1X7LW97_9BURK|nr:ABC transporter substrate-binding protein [Paraburkholderia susongensis]SMG58115.1 peptide/nickel transport system substrate-binding protein [Paraburkholderia susongensis]